MSEIKRRQFVKFGVLGASALALPGFIQGAKAADGQNRYTLPKLGYEFAALEPYVDARTMEIHYSKHHVAYMNGLNAVMKGVSVDASKPLEVILAELPAVSDEATRAGLRNHGGGFWNHCFFWESMTPAGQVGVISSALEAAIKGQWGSVGEFQTVFGEAAAKRFGSGWAWLVWQNGKLKVTSTANQDNPFMKGLVDDAELGVPLLGLDVWEHAYYLQYQNRRADYIKAWWQVVNWAEVSRRYERTQEVKAEK